MKKTYRSRLHKYLALSGMVENNMVRVDFINGNSNNNCIYTTDKAEEQELIENHEYFKKGLLYISSTEEVEKPVTKEKESATMEETSNIEVVEYANRQDLFEQLSKRFEEENIKKTDTIAELQTVAEKHNIKISKKEE